LALEIGYRGPELTAPRIESKPAVGYLIRTCPKERSTVVSHLNLEQNESWVSWEAI